MKQKRIRCFLFILFILAALALACSCSLDTQEDGPTADLVAPAVDSVDPYDGEDSVSVVPSITIEFSEEVERVGAEQAFSLSDGASNVDGSISWSGNAMVF
ncbi:MAG: Ig-like domain-containing protein, partial [Spirochaetales bacterium]|nr:Ig-like domain-containing protein [Spirochaetales bacterium]